MTTFFTLCVQMRLKSFNLKNRVCALVGVRLMSVLWYEKIERSLTEIYEFIEFYIIVISIRDRIHFLAFSISSD